MYRNMTCDIEMYRHIPVYTSRGSGDTFMACWQWTVPESSDWSRSHGKVLYTLDWYMIF